MKNIKDELQNIILGDEFTGKASKLKKVQCFLKSNEGTGFPAEKQQQFKGEETAKLLAFAEQESLFYTPAIQASDFISEGAEQKVYRFDEAHVLKTNSRIFYENWLDYFNSLLIHNYFFPATAYTFLGFKMINGELNGVVLQDFIVTTELTDLNAVKEFLEFNHFQNNRNNDYINNGLGLILEDLHDENVLSANDVLFFIDTIFYITPDFYIS
ncbi:hypothetical protein [Mucilaginibacter flavus]|uniref:putative polyvalent protein kinase domain-containing protein n=1 Tax=Mucilaginibacter flavus TaxID=931504 RepID=UPI0025B4B5CB|nr:hypothetical protein [Mucilaginibacter flavus]MDN3583954.1 hypothetical protein [Mucilaginibacter flavus]